jgi:hypothetical protein
MCVLVFWQGQTHCVLVFWRGQTSGAGLPCRTRRVNALSTMLESQEEPLLLRTFRCHFGAVSGVPASLALGCIDVRHAWAKLLASTTSCIKLAIDIGPGVQSAESASHDLVQK